MDGATIKEVLDYVQASLASVPKDIPALGQLIATLEQHCDVLPGGDSTWKPRFWEQWESLEGVYAVALDRQESSLDEECQKIVTDAIAELRTLIADVSETQRTTQPGDYDNEA